MTRILKITDEDFKAIKVSREEFLEDMLLLDEYGFDYDRNIVRYLHDIAEQIRYCNSED